MDRDFRFYIRTYGCRVNQYECQSIRERWCELGGTETDQPEEADVILVSSCAVTAQAVSDARQAARQFAGLEGKTLIVTGCAAGPAYDSFAVKGVDLIVPQKQKHMLLNVHPLERGAIVRDSEKIPFPPFRISGFYRARPVVKVQDGCSQFCTYCIVPLTRGPARSRPADEVVAEISRLLQGGYREILISGINLRQYHTEDACGRDFWALLRRINRTFAPEWQGRARFRLSSLEPAQVTQSEARDTLEECTMLCPHLHLSLQSGSEAVLRRMGRSVYSPSEIIDFISSLRDVWPMMGLGADILMGFPGETDSEVAETAGMLKLLPMTYAHIFSYSRRPGTRAAQMQGQLSTAEKRAHTDVARAILAEKKRDFLLEQTKLPGMKVAFDTNTALHGVNEWYVSCRMAEGTPVPAQPGHELSACVPVGIDDGVLMVVPRPF